MDNIWELLCAQHFESPITHAVLLALLGKKMSGKMSHVEVMVVGSKKFMSREINPQIFSQCRVK